MKHLNLALTIAALLLGVTVGCKVTDTKPDAAATAKGTKSPVPDTIESVKTNAAAAIAAVEKKVEAVEKRSATAAASVDAIKSANTNQPPSPATDFVGREASLALGNLPVPDALAALDAEKRRSAVFSGQVDEVRKLYAAAQTEGERLKSEMARAKADADAAKSKHDAAQAALVEADRKWAAQLRVNEAENKAKLNDAVKRADEAEERAKNERHKLIFRSLLGLGLACIAGAIAMAVLTQGAMLGKSLMLAGGGALCIAVAQVISHPYFDRIFGGCIALAVVGGAAYLFFEWQDAVKKRVTDKAVAVLDRVKDKATVMTVGEDGKESNLAMELSRKFGDAEKAVVKKLRLINAIKAVTRE